MFTSDEPLTHGNDGMTALRHENEELIWRNLFSCIFWQSVKFFTFVQTENEGGKSLAQPRQFSPSDRLSIVSHFYKQIKKETA